MRFIRLLIVLALVVSACGDDDAATTVLPATTTTTVAPATTTTAPPATTTTAPPSTTTTTVPPTTTTTAPPTTTTTVPPTTTTTAPPTTTTTAPPPMLAFELNGLGIVDFGDSVDDVFAAMVGIFGAPFRDTGWIDEPLCPGPMNRFVDFGTQLFDFQVMFTTGDLFAAAGVEHFFSYRYNGATPVPINPPDLTVGTKVSELQALHPTVVFEPNPFLNDVMDYRVAGPGSEGLSGRVSGVNPGDVVLTVQGGVGCAE